MAQTAARLKEGMTVSRNPVAGQKSDNEGLEGQKTSKAKGLAQVRPPAERKKGQEGIFSKL